MRVRRPPGCSDPYGGLRWAASDQVLGLRAEGQLNADPAAGGAIPGNQRPRANASGLRRAGLPDAEDCPASPIAGGPTGRGA